MDSTTIVNVLAGDLPDDEHAAAMERFWDTCPRLEPMRQIVTEVVAHRRAAAARHDLAVEQISAQYDAKLKDAWSWLAKAETAAEPMTAHQIENLAEASKKRSKEISQAKAAEITKAIRENYADVERCLRLLYWNAERQTIAQACGRRSTR